ncbi:MAG: PocR ligand-binding domain-containing protein [Eubacterium sp.]
MKEFEFLDEKYTRYMFECFSNATGLHLKGVDLLGDVFLELENLEECGFCVYVKSCHEEKCTASYKQACLEAAKWKEPYFFRCHAGLVMWAVPILVEETCVGALICGQVLLWEIDEFFIEELSEMNRDIPDFESLCQHAGALSILSPHKSQAVAELLQAIMNYLSKVNTSGYLEQRKTAEWRNTILQHMDERRSHFLEDPFEYDRYLKKEKQLLQWIRTGERDRVLEALPDFFTTVYVVSNYDLKRIKIRLLEWMSSVSRAIVEAGLDSHIAMIQSEKIFIKCSELKSAETLFDYLSNIIKEYMEDLFITSEGTQKSVLKASRAYINIHLADLLRIDDIAEAVGISASRLSHLFKETFNYTVNDYIVRVRIEHAVALMEKREMTLGDIAQKCGFKSSSHFSKVFKKYLGLNPKDYRNRFTE